MNHVCWLALALALSPIACAQQLEKVQPIPTAHNKHLVSMPIGLVREARAAAKDLAEFHDPAWSALTIAQIGAASADEATSLNNFHACPTCVETGVSRFFLGQRPDAHKYAIGGAIEIGVEAVASHYFRHHGPVRKWYWKTLWTFPQSFSLYEHARAAHHNARLDLGCAPSAPTCN
jgi:hypothetical protein